MKIGFTFKDIKSSLYNITWKTANRPTSATLKRREVSIPYKHGVIDYGNNDYDKLIITGEIQFIGDDYFELRRRKRDIAQWLNTSEFQELSFDDEAGLFYRARVFNSVNLDTFFKTGKMQVTFECQPFSIFPYKSGDQIKWGEAHFTWGEAHIPWGGPTVYSIDVTGTDSIDVEYIGTQQIDYKAPEGNTFNIIIDGSFDDISIELNGKTINYTEAISSAEVIINTVDMEVEKDGVNRLDVVTGDIATFFCLLPGINTINITGTNLNCNVAIDTNFLYL